MEKNRIKYVMKNLFADSSSMSERAEAAKWINSRDAEHHSEEIWKTASENIQPFLKNEIWKHIQQEITKTVPSPASVTYTVKHRIYTISKVAALFAVILCSAFTLYLLHHNMTGNKRNIADNIYSVEVKPGQKGSIRLSDGTVVHLNSASKISFAGDYNTENRRINLNGEAYFEVAENPHKKFIVSCNGIEVEALGTEFNIKAYPADSTVVTTLAKGKVKVSSSRQSVTLLPNDVATYNLKQNTIEPSTVDDISIADYWRSGQLVFRAEPFSSIARTIERMYNVKIDINDIELKTMKFTGTIRNNSLNNIIHLISMSYPLTYTITDSVITLSTQKTVNEKYNFKTSVSQ